jgi:hypothetical protein
LALWHACIGIGQFGRTDMWTGANHDSKTSRSSVRTAQVTGSQVGNKTDGLFSLSTTRVLIASCRDVTDVPGTLRVPHSSTDSCHTC